MSHANAMFRGLVEKGLANFHIKDNAEELMNKDYEPNKNIKPYLLATFGSAWAVVSVKINNQDLQFLFRGGFLENSGIF